MKLWILRPKKNFPDGVDHWNPPYDCAHGYVVRADTAKIARCCISAKVPKQCGDETRHHNVWKDPKCTTCRQLKETGKEGIILRDFYSA